jgi:hypothetical protein
LVQLARPEVEATIPDYPVSVGFEKISHRSELDSRRSEGTEEIANLSYVILSRASVLGGLHGAVSLPDNEPYVAPLR